MGKANIRRSVLEGLIRATAEPLALISVTDPDWPIVLCNPALEALADTADINATPAADFVESLHGREASRELGEILRSGQASSVPLEMGGRAWLLVLQPVADEGGREPRYFAACWRDAAAMTGGDASAAHQALLRARRRIRDLAREDSLTGLLNEGAFRDLLAHDWAVAAREERPVALLALQIDELSAYREVFGRHATDSCLRRVAQALRRCLRRASDIAARLSIDDAEYFVVLFHAQEQGQADALLETVAASVRELGLHHPRAHKERFVTVSGRGEVRNATGGPQAAAAFLEELLGD